MRIHSQLRFRRTTVIIYGLLSFLVGIGVARLKIPINSLLIWLAFGCSVVTFKFKNIVCLLCVITFGLSLGLWRGDGYMHKLDLYQPLYRQKVTLVGRADDDGTYSKGSQLTFDLTNLKIQSLQNVNLVGKIGVKGYGENAIYRGDVVKVSGKLYPTRGSRQASISYAQISVLQRSKSTINVLRRRFEAGMLSALPEPMASFGLGLLIGQRSTLTQEITDQLSADGLTHIVAVSGYNLTIIIGIVYYLLKKLSKYQATLGSVLLILLFIIFTGTSASIIRAAIVSLLSIAATYYGRTLKPLMLILLAAALTAGWSPTYLWSDIGWYLSFLAFFGVLVISPLVIKRLSSQKQAKLLLLVIVETMAAQLMTVPIIMYIFGQISLVSLPANILIVPLVPLAMVLSFIAALAGMLIPAMAGWLALPARIVLTYMLDMIGFVAKVPHALSLQSLKISQVIGLYCLIVGLCWLLWLKTKDKNDILTDINSEET